MNLVFVARSKSPDEWKAVASAISTLVDEATFEGFSRRHLFQRHGSVAHCAYRYLLAQSRI